MACALNGSATEQHIRDIALTANLAEQGMTSNIGEVEFADGVRVVTVQDKRCGRGRLCVLVPRNSNAANATWFLRTMTDGSMELVSDGSGRRVFGYVIVGVTR